MSELVARRWVVQGRVQGVGFRWFIQTRAQAMGVRGWASNLPDGSVEVVGMATALTLAEFEALVRQGPRGARVTDITRDEVPHDVVDAKSFVIK
ncbi:MAG: acylphosphatase [Gemmatimonadales bacterium]